VKDKVKILLTNDDGYQAPGLEALFNALSTVADVTVVAPDRERSAISLAITLADIIRVSPIENGSLKGFHTTGTPADCVKIGCSELMDSRPDYIFSGINSGSNVGLNANYSGTVAGAVEGAMLGIPSVAVSLTSYDFHDYRGACQASLKILDMIKENPLNQFELLNINVPSLPLDEIKGMRISRVSLSSFREKFDRRTDARDREYFWMGGIWNERGADLDGDRFFSDEGYVAVTPLKVDWTAEGTLQRLREKGWDQDWNGEIDE